MLCLGREPLARCTSTQASRCAHCSVQALSSCMHAQPPGALQTGEVVAIKKIHLQEAKEVR